MKGLGFGWDSRGQGKLVGSEPGTLQGLGVWVFRGLGFLGFFRV